MKLTNALVTKTSQNLDKVVTSDKNAKAELSATVMTWLKDDKATQVFLNWLTANSKVVKDETKVQAEDRRQSGRNFQNIVNQTPFQRAYYGIEKGQPLTNELRVKKAKTTMVTSGDATQEQLESKQVFKFDRKLNITPATAKSDFDKFCIKWKLSTKQVIALANTRTVNA
jgi:hypothetical protein